ncbi:MAG TPA: VCBS repeat-containing protein, partial [Candidatus Deferrimicrobiaceae bacterium]
MRKNPVRAFGGGVSLAALLVIVLVAFSAPSKTSAAGYPRRVAVAPFVSLAKEDIASTVAVLPRLVASRLMALAGADTLLLPAEGKAPSEAAKEAKFPLLLQGTVAKLGKGYSIDVTVTDLATGASAGAFFAAAATEDDIIPQLGVLSGEIAEKVFGVQGAIRSVSPPPPPAAAPVQPASPAGGTVAVYGVPAATAAPPVGSAASVAPSAAPAQPPPPAPGTLAEGWVPSSLKKVGQSDKIVDEIHGVATGDVDGEGNGEVVTYSRTAIYVYRVKGNEILPYTRLSRPLSHQILNVEAFDVDGDGKKDLVVTDREGDRLKSFVMLRKGDGFVETPGTSPYFLVDVRDPGGKGWLAGQREGIANDPFNGKLYRMKWDGKVFSEDKVLPIDTAILPTAKGGVPSLTAGRFGAEERWMYVDIEDKLRV